MIEKITDAFANIHRVVKTDEDLEWNRAVWKCTEIVQEVAKEYDWIPVEQKTPEDFTYVYATCVSLVDDRKAWVIEGVYHSLTGWEELTPYLSLGKAKVIAWMPKKLPTPYQKGE